MILKSLDMPTIKELFDDLELFTKDASEVLSRLDENYFVDLYESNKLCFYYYPFILTKFIDNQKIRSNIKIAFEKWDHIYYSCMSEAQKKQVSLFKDFAIITDYCSNDIFNKMVSCIEFPEENVLFFEELGLDLEDWIDFIIWKNKRKNELHPSFQSNSHRTKLGYKIIIYLIRNFYLPRFDFRSVKLLLKALNEKNSISIWQKVKNWFYDKNKNSSGLRQYKQSIWSIIWSTIKVTIPLLIIWFAYSGGAFNWSLFDSVSFPLTFKDGQYIIGSDKQSLQIANIKYNSIFGFSEFVSIIIIIGIIIRIFVKPNSIYLFSPRLFIGIIVGYIPIMAESTFMNLAVSSSVGKSIWLIIFLTSVSLTFTYLYLRFEVRKGTGSEDNILIRARTLNIYSKGVLYSFMLGLVLIDLFTSVYIRCANAIGVLPDLEKMNRFHAGIFGIMDPLIILFYFPLALFIGVVIQFIWEEKPITHPIK
jgi:hypothetical protein